MDKNIGVVIKFNEGTCIDYGFIDSFFSTENIFFHRSFLIAGVPRRGDFVSFEPIHSAKGWRGEKVSVLNAQSLADEIDFSDAEAYEKIRQGILRMKGYQFLKDVVAAIPEENLFKYAWLRRDLGYRERVELCLKMFREEPSNELEEEISTAIKNVGEIKFSFPSELAIKEKFWIHVDKASKIATLKKFAPILSEEELFKIIDKPDAELSITEMATILREVLGNEKFSKLLMNFAAQNQNFDEWAKVILENNFPNDAIITHWHKLNDENKIAAFEKYFDELTTEKVVELSKNLSPEKIFPLIRDKEISAEKISALIDASYRKYEWAKCLIDDIELFKAADLCDDVIIFFVYEFVKREKNLNELANALLAKKETIQSSSRLQVVCRYVWAAYEKSCGNIDASERAKRRAEEALAAIFNEIAQKLEEITEHGEEFEFMQHEAHILPPCTERRIKDCRFCEAVTWPQKSKDESGNIVWKFGRNYCPRINSTHLDCFRIEPNLNLSFENWSVVELTKALGLMKYETQRDLEFFMRIGGEFNRLYELKKILRCHNCGKYMRSTKSTQWKKVLNLRTLTWKKHFAVFNATTFSCLNKNCPDHGKKVYISYCWHCGGLIDSRVNHVRIGGYYSCLHCGAGYRDVAAPGYALFPGKFCPSCTKCPNCGGQEFALLRTDDKFRLECKNCSKIFIPKTTLSTENKRNFRCTNDECNETLKVIPEIFEEQEAKMNLKEIPWD